LVRPEKAGQVVDGAGFPLIPGAKRKNCAQSGPSWLLCH
jgi:hypothetical protein